MPRGQAEHGDAGTTHSLEPVHPRPAAVFYQQPSVTPPVHHSPHGGVTGKKQGCSHVAGQLYDLQVHSGEQEMIKGCQG